MTPCNRRAVNVFVKIFKLYPKTITFSELDKTDKKPDFLVLELYNDMK